MSSHLPTAFLRVNVARRRVGGSHSLRSQSVARVGAHGFFARDARGPCAPCVRLTGRPPISFAWPCGGAYGHEGFAADSSHFRTRRFPIGGAAPGPTGLRARLGERIAAAVPGPRLVVFEVRAHSPNVERSRRFNGILRDFLRGRLVDDGAGAAHAAIG